jgi:hypothetical protein
MHFQHVSPPLHDTRTLLVKVIVSQEESVRDQVIRATNNQSTVEPAALHATDRIQRSIEEILLRNDWFYERRTNFFKNEGRPESRILSPIAVASGSVALLLKNPVLSSRFRQKHLRKAGAYQTVYSEAFPIDVWPVVASLIRGAEHAISRFYQTRRQEGRGQHLSAWRGLLAYMAAVRILGTFDYKIRDLAAVDASTITDDLMNECWAAIRTTLRAAGPTKITETQMQQVCAELVANWGITGQPTDGLRNLPTSPSRPRAHEEFLSAVTAALPPQPWRPRVHVDVAQVLGVKPFLVTKAIKVLIERGLCMKQKDGIVFDQEGNEIMRDESRALRSPTSA